MSTRRRAHASWHVEGMLVGLAMLVLGACQIGQAGSAVWHDPSPHQVRFVTVAPDVRLEVLDWGGSGRAVVLLAGSGNTAHVFDELAPKLTDCCHVYGVTRRGFGASTHAPGGYDNQRLADDVLAVVDALHLTTPILAGHSMAGGEITTLGHQHSNRLGGLVYLDALGDPRDWPASDPDWMALLNKLPAGAREPPSACGLPSTTFDSYRVWQRCREHFAFPESELHNTFVTNADGSMGPSMVSARVHSAIGDGEVKRDYSGIRVPVLALFEFPRPAEIKYLRPEEYHPKTDEERLAMEAFGRATKAYMDRWVEDLMRHVPDAHLVNLPGAGHYVFLTRETEVLTEIRAFASKLP